MLRPGATELAGFEVLDPGRAVGAAVAAPERPGVAAVAGEEEGDAVDVDDALHRRVGGVGVHVLDQRRAGGRRDWLASTEGDQQGGAERGTSGKWSTHRRTSLSPASGRRGMPWPSAAPALGDSTPGGQAFDTRTWPTSGVDATTLRGPCRRPCPFGRARVVDSVAMHENDRGPSLVEQSPRPSTHDACANGTGPSRAPLSCDRIVAAALRYVDHNCLDDLSMRRLGGELGVEAMSLYRYFPSKAALLDAVVGRVLADVALPPRSTGSDWEAHVRVYAQSFRGVAREHPHVVSLLATHGSADRSQAAIRERMLDLWRQAGFDREGAGQAQCLLQGYLMGSSLLDLPPEDEAACTADFAFGLDVLLSGLRQRLAETAAVTAVRPRA